MALDRLFYVYVSVQDHPAPVILVIIPAFNEENSVGNVIREIPMDIVAEVIVVNNNSNDQTAIQAAAAGAGLLVITHDETVASRADRIVRIADGRIA